MTAKELVRRIKSIILKNWSSGITEDAEWMEMAERAILEAKSATRQAALEEAAKIAEEERDWCRRNQKEGSDLQAAGVGASARIAAAIRKLKEEKP